MAYSTQFLYELEPKTLSTMLYPEALKFKITSAKLLLERLMNEHYSKRDDYRVNAVIKAIKFNEQLLEEILC